jgi:N-acetyl-1-D-myo-inositol-2-amino-2-deoxy-alpha-D-glucopyranoside deacetylase
VGNDRKVRLTASAKATAVRRSGARRRKPDPTGQLAGRTVLGVFAHPDDESLACGGTLARAADAGAKVVVLCATHGERGSICDPSLVPDGDLGRVRARELHDAAAVLDIDDVVVLDHPDGDVRWTDVPLLHEEIIAIIRRYRPDAVITFDEDGLYWHMDHIGVHERTLTAVTSLGRNAPPLYFVTMPTGVMRQVVEAAHAKSGLPTDTSLWGITPDVFGFEAEPPTFSIDVRNWVGRKLAALRCHRTQMGPHNPFVWIDEEEARRWLGTELFRRAPIDAAGPAVLELLGEPVTSS